MSNVVKKTLEIRDRGNSTFSASTRYKFKDLLREITKVDELNNQQSFYFVVSYISNAEIFFRALFREMIEQGPQYLDSSIKILEDSLSKKELIDTIVNVGTKRVGIGEIISHSLSISSVEQVVKYFDYFGSKKTIPMIKELSKTQTFVNDFPNFVFEESFSSLKDLFSARHILCHENPEYHPFTKVELASKLSSGIAFFDLFFRLQQHLLGIPDMDCEATRRGYAIDVFEKSNKELFEIVQLVKTHLSEAGYQEDIIVKEFEQSQEAWEKYRNAEAQSFSNQMRGGTGSSLLYSTQLTAVTIQRIELLRDSWSGYLPELKSKIL